MFTDILWLFGYGWIQLLFRNKCEKLYLLWNKEYNDKVW